MQISELESWAQVCQALSCLVPSHLNLQLSFSRSLACLAKRTCFRRMKVEVDSNWLFICLVLVSICLGCFGCFSGFGFVFESLCQSPAKVEEEMTTTRVESSSMHPSFGDNPNREPLNLTITSLVKPSLHWLNNLSSNQIPLDKSTCFVETLGRIDGEGL